ncbi:MAG: glycosyltransferase [Bacteroidetes bacterium]|nr:glycosyltransferase [Bacteroidota bacterium]
MKLLFLTPWYPDARIKNHGVFVREQAVALGSVHEVVVISAKIDYQNFGLCSYQFTESVFGNVKEYRLVIKRSLPIYNQLNYFFISRKIALKIAKYFQPDVVHGNIGYPGAFWSWLVSNRLRKPLVITEHTFVQNNFRSNVHKQLTLFSLRKANAVIAVSNSLASTIEKYAQVKAQVIPNIVEASRFSIEPFPKGKTAIGFVGGLSSPKHVKGLDTLLRVLSQVKKDFVLHVAGDGALMNEYQTRARELSMFEKCKFYGFVDYERIPSFMNQLHFFVNTSRFETFGISIVEAMASGLPVVCFDNGGPGDFVNSSNGILVENQNEEKLKEAIEWMIDNYEGFNREVIRKVMIEKFSREEFIHKMNLFHKTLIN